MNLSGIADAAAAIFHRVRIDALAIAPRARYSNAIILARYRCEVADDDCELMRISAKTHVGNYALGSICDVDPAKSFGIAIEPVKSGRAAIQMVQITY